MRTFDPLAGPARKEHHRETVPRRKDRDSRRFAVRTVVIGIAAIVATLVVPATASAVPRSAVGSCPAAPAGWEQMSVADASDAIYPYVVDPPPPDAFVSQIQGYDVNGDGQVCVAVRAQKNERAHWFGIPLFVLKDNNTGAR
jgi:hypothetical protein